MITKDIISALDSSNMFATLVDFHKQIRAFSIDSQKKIKLQNPHKINKIVIFGMGGSAISGDLARSFIANNNPEIEIPITVVRNYQAPNWIDNETLVIAISYSGNTEETITSLNQAMEKTNNIVCITSGGELEQIAKNKNYPLLMIPSGYQPRAALGYLFIAVYNFLISSFCKVCTLSRTVIEEQMLADLLEARAKVYSELTENNPALSLAKQLVGKQVIVYSSSNVLDIVNLRWRGQLQENAKNLAFGGYLPEMNHNEINSYQFPQTIIENSYLLFLLDPSDNPRVINRIRATHEIINEKWNNAQILESSEEIPLLRIFDLIYLADWTSCYLSILNNQDPTPIPLISQLKDIMSKY
jgi:glucose/mannose-6-phosphate isomerase